MANQLEWRRMRFFLKPIFVALSHCLLFFCISSNAAAFEEERCRLLQDKACVDYSERIIEGVATSQCWKYEQKFDCISKEQNHCSSLEANRGCNELSSNCSENSNLGLCKNLEKKFSCGKKLEERSEIKHIDTQFHVRRDEKDLSNCSKEEINQYCEIAEEVCLEPKETRNINGKEITKDCWKWDRKYVCRSDNLVDECKDLPANCKFTGEKECLHSLKINNQEVCDHWEVKYDCLETTTRKNECLAGKFCLGGVCETNIRAQHNDFGEGISNLSVLAAMKSDEIDGCKCPNGKQSCEPHEFNANNCKLFTGNGKQCTKATSQHNCCSEKGLFRKIQDCSQEEKDLFVSRQAKLCHPVGSWKGKKLNWYKKHQSFCCFKSKLAKIIQVQGRAQLGIGWGDRKNPDCRALTLEEIRRIDFSRIDFSDLFNELKDKARDKVEKNQSDMKSKLQNTQANPAAMSEVINQKIKKFYSGAK